jgi:membrane protease YdiL (CAAX protease family)
MAPDVTPNAPSTPASETAPVPPASSGPNPMLFGPQGLREGWRILMFIALVAALRYVQLHIQPLRHFIQEVTAAQGEEAPAPVIVVEGVRALIVLLAAFLMTRIEKRSFADYGLPMNQAFGKRFWQGLALGFAMLSLLLAAIGALHGFSLAGLAVSGAKAVKFGLLWALAFFLVGVFEDFMFRGYLQSALADEIGFWPAALILAVIFGAIHWNNQGEALFGCVTAGMFGFMEAFALSRTRSLWLLFGMHTSWDWGETYFYGTPDSGILATGHLFNSSFHGAKWLTGGTVGPEGSWLVLVVLVLWVVAIHFLFPAEKSTAR